MLFNDAILLFSEVNFMKPGDFIALHTPDGTFIAKMISDDGDTITAECGTLFGNKIYYGIPKDVVTLYLSVS